MHAKGSGSGVRGLGHGEAVLALAGDAGYFDPRPGDDDTTQAGDLFRLMPGDARQRLCDNIASSLGAASADVRQRRIAHFDRADPANGAGVRAALDARDTRRAEG